MANRKLSVEDRGICKTMAGVAFYLFMFLVVPLLAAFFNPVAADTPDSAQPSVISTTPAATATSNTNLIKPWHESDPEAIRWFFANCIESVPIESDTIKNQKCFDELMGLAAWYRSRADLYKWTVPTLPPAPEEKTLPTPIIPFQF